jgi:hydrogenase maturation protein HypF
MARLRLKIHVTGIVQGVGFRPFIYRVAVAKGLHGYVQNRGDAGVEIIVEGQEETVQSFLEDLKSEKPPLSQIYSITTLKLEGSEEFTNFLIKKSSNEVEVAGSVIPPDIAICDDCLRELRDSRNHRFEYFFITCVNCGPRFTIIEKLPCDRENTTMREFPMCGFCREEYQDPSNRRFHAQTVACPICGPEAYLVDAEGKRVDHKDPVRETGKLLSEGYVVAVKGYGGFHIALSATKMESLTRIRRVKHRSQKPFAVMARNIESIKSFTEVTTNQELLLSSYTRPVVLLRKSSQYHLSELVAPGLHNVGVMLPYTGLHYMLFDKVEDAAFVMTSANPPNQPIVNDNDEALEALKGTVDYFLFHNRKIAHRCDDSVVRMHKDNTIFIRRSRGYSPAPIKLNRKADRCVLALGGELNNTSCILNGDKAFISQHIGDVDDVETRTFLENASKHLALLTNSKIQIVAHDLHPKFVTTKLAADIAAENGLQTISIQHHYAHAAALMAEHDTKEIICICCDGYGYGSNGEAWGGELLLCNDSVFGFKRVGHLEKQPMIGGDLATYQPLRMAAGILEGNGKVEDWLINNQKQFPHGEKEIRIFLHQLERKQNIVYTTSCGRVLDAVSAVLGICLERTYEGEPSMKLESLAIEGKDALDLEPSFEDDILCTRGLVEEIFERKDKQRKADLAYSAHVYLAKGLAALAVEKALQNDVKAVGFSGGVACNEIVAFNIRKIVEASGLRFLVHEVVPPGDGGLSFGQAIASGFVHS